MICAAIQAKGATEFLDHVNLVKDKASLAEVRLDFFKDPYSVDFEELVQASPVPLIFTNRRHNEGGNIQQEEEKRLSLLKQAVNAGAEYIDVEFGSDKSLRNELLAYANERSCKVIVSWHDFQKTPTYKDLVKMLKEMGECSAHIIKMVTTALNQSDVKRLLSLYCLALVPKLKLLAFCMGDIGKISRVACLALGAPFSFASCTEKGATAPGQLTVQELFDILRVLDY